MVYKRGNAYWYKFRWSLTNSEGSKENFVIRRSARVKNRNDAKDAEREHRRALALGQIHPNDVWPKAAVSGPPIFRAFAKEFQQYCKTHTKEGTTVFYDTCLERIQNFAAIADAPLNAITGEVVSRYARHRQEVAENSVVTVNGDLRTIRRILHLAVEWGRLPSVPVIHELPQPKGRERVITFAEEQLYLAKASDNLRDAAILAVDTGLRPNSELFPLKWIDVELTPTNQTPFGAIHVRQGKTESAQRAVPLTPRAADALKRRKREAEALPKQSAFVFPGAGRSGHLVSMQHPHEAAITDAGLESFEFYCWRHTFGTRSAQSGMDRFSLARLMGHSSPSVAARYYIHVTENHVAAGFGKFLDYHAIQLSDGIKEAFPEVTAEIQ